ncbi:MAG: hypothetical protein PHX93_05585 [Candidatus Peribacteraceae bacterium]|jgi:hypothetical protein|nr:hypothetical protein [Candidatus Peribacteraceae bacterium]
MSTADHPTDTDQEEMYIPGPERDMDFSVFDGFDVPSFIRDHHGIPDVAKSSQPSVRDRLRAIQQKVIENDPITQCILAGIVHDRAQESKTPDADALKD